MKSSDPIFINEFRRDTRLAVRKAIADHPDMLAEYQAGKEALFGFFIGVVMRTLCETYPIEVVEPIIINEVLRAALAQPHRHLICTYGPKGVQ